MTPQSSFNARLDPYDDLPPQYPGEDDVARPKPPSLAAVSRSLTSIDAATSQEEPLHHAITAPASLPPPYRALDPLPTHLTLAAPLIHASTSTSSTSVPRFHLSQTLTKSGRPLTLSIRHLLPTESRCLSSGSQTLCPCYDDDITLYHISRHGMRGLRAGTLGGNIQLTSGAGVKGRWWRFWHVVRSRKYDALDPANEPKMQKYGYRAEDEWEKRVLFLVRRGKWLNGDGEKVAVEIDEKKKGVSKGLRILDAVGDKSRRDLVVACWVMRVWMGRGVSW